MGNLNALRTGARSAQLQRLYQQLLASPDVRALLRRLAHIERRRVAAQTNRENAARRIQKTGNVSFFSQTNSSSDDRTAPNSLAAP